MLKTNDFSNFFANFLNVLFKVIPHSLPLLLPLLLQAPSSTSFASPAKNELNPSDDPSTHHTPHHHRSTAADSLVELSLKAGQRLSLFLQNLPVLQPDQDELQLILEQIFSDSELQSFLREFDITSPDLSKLIAEVDSNFEKHPLMILGEIQVAVGRIEQGLRDLLRVAITFFRETTAAVHEERTLPSDDSINAQIKLVKPIIEEILTYSLKADFSYAIYQISRRKDDIKTTLQGRLELSETATLAELLEILDQNDRIVPFYPGDLEEQLKESHSTLQASNRQEKTSQSLIRRGITPNFMRTFARWIKGPWLRNPPNQVPLEIKRLTTPTASDAPTPLDARDGGEKTTSSFRLINRLLNHSSFAKVSTVALHPTAPLIATGTSGKPDITVWNLETRTVLYEIKEHKNAIYYLGFSPSGDTLASIDISGELILWHFSPSTFSLKHRVIGNFETIAFSPTDDTYTIASSSHPKQVQIRTLSSNKKVLDISSEGRSGNARLKTSHLAYSPDGNWIAVAPGNKNIQIYELPSGDLKATLRGHKGKVTALQFSPDGKYLVSAESNLIRFWKLDDRTVDAVLTDERSSETRALQFSPDGRHLVSVEKEGTVHFWNIKSGQIVHSIEGSTHSHKTIALSQDNRTLVRGRPTRIEAWLVRGRPSQIEIWNIAPIYEARHHETTKKPSNRSLHEPTEEDVLIGRDDHPTFVYLRYFLYLLGQSLEKLRKEIHEEQNVCSWWFLKEELPRCLTRTITPPSESCLLRYLLNTRDKAD